MWLRTYELELEELLKKLRNDEIKVIISGDLFNNKSFMAHLYTKHMAIIK